MRVDLLAAIIGPGVDTQRRVQELIPKVPIVASIPRRIRTLRDSMFRNLTETRWDAQVFNNVRVDKMIAMSGKMLEAGYTGLRAGEKLHEELHSDFEVEVAPLHPKISHAPVLGLSPDDLDLDAWHNMVAHDAAHRSRDARRIGLESMAKDKLDNGSNNTHQDVIEGESVSASGGSVR